MELLDFHHHLERAGVEEVADQYRGGIAELGVGGGGAPPQGGLVDDVVVQQGGGMDEFDHRGHQPVVTLRALLFGLAVAESAGEESEQHGPEPLAACIDDVGGNGADQGDGAV